jgi:hypothetical protein
VTVQPLLIVDCIVDVLTRVGQQLWTLPSLPRLASRNAHTVIDVLPLIIIYPDLQDGGNINITFSVDPGYAAATGILSLDLMRGGSTTACPLLAYP